jgi:outer membrane lipoprotein-sorting protein
MNDFLRATAAVVAVGLATTAASAAASAERTATPTLDAVALHMAAVHDYSATIDAHEVEGSSSDDRAMRFWFLGPDHAKLEVLKGQGAGTRLIWSGGSKVGVRGGVFSLFPVSLDLHDPRITSPRGNTMLRAEFQPVLDCFATHRNAVAEAPGPPLDGQATVLVTLSIAGGISCPGDSERDREVTKDVLTVAKATAVVQKRERYVGDALVERWVLSDMKFNSGLTDADFQ